jgi:CRP/FNR family cyclic AMP-dependent transcriptional regulator
MHDFHSSVAVALQQTGLLDDVGLGDLHAFALHLERRELAPRDHLFEQGDDGDGWYVILSGVIAIVRHEDGDSHVLDHLEAPDSFGEMALIDGAPRMASAEADTPSVVARLPRTTFDSLLASGDPLAIRLLRAMSGVMCRRHRQLTWLLSDLVSFDEADITNTPVPPSVDALLRSTITWH